MDLNRGWINHLRSNNKKLLAEPRYLCPICHREFPNSSLHPHLWKEHKSDIPAGYSNAERENWVNMKLKDASLVESNSQSHPPNTSQLPPQSSQQHRQEPRHRRGAVNSTMQKKEPEDNEKMQQMEHHDDDDDDYDDNDNYTEDTMEDTMDCDDEIDCFLDNEEIEDQDLDEFGRAVPHPENQIWSDGRHDSSGTPTAPTSHESQSSSTPYLKQLASKKITLEDLIIEVKGIYAAVAILESKCIEIDHAHSKEKNPDLVLNNQQWRALVQLHMHLVNHHFDFLTASQVPWANPSILNLAAKYAMPSRLWRHGIHAFLEILRHHLPNSLEHMLRFLYHSFHIISLLAESVSAFRDTWIECLGDLSRYRMAIEAENMEERKIWASASRHWYNKALNAAPNSGRLNHHLAILARPDAMQQWHFYSKSLCSPSPFPSARNSILTLLTPLLEKLGGNPNNLQPIQAAFARMHGILFTDTFTEQLEQWKSLYFADIRAYASRDENNWPKHGPYVAITNLCSLFGYGQDGNVFMDVYKGSVTEAEVDSAQLSEKVEIAMGLNYETHRIMFNRFKELNTMPYVHVVLGFIYNLTFYPTVLRKVGESIPWRLLATYLNALVALDDPKREFWEIDELPSMEEGDPEPFPEDYMMRGLIWADHYPPEDLFSDLDLDVEDKLLERPSVMRKRACRVLYLGVRIALRASLDGGAGGIWLRFNPNAKKGRGGPFSVDENYPKYGTEKMRLDMTKLKLAFRTHENTFD